MSKNRSNFEHIGNGFYICYTQAGFEQALYHRTEPDEGKKGLERRELEGDYPREYPSLVNFSWEYMGYHYWRAHCLPIRKLKERIK